MRHGKVTRNLGVKTGHRTGMLRNLAKGLVRDGRIRTTSARAKTLRPFLEKLVTRLKDPTVANIRHVASVLNDKPTLQSLVSDIAPVFKDRAGGYIRILKLAQRRPGDNADMALVEWVDEGLVEKGLAARYPEAKAAGTTKKAAKKTAKKASKKDEAEGSDTKAEKTKKAPAKAAKAKATKKDK
ncbi:MAG: 50S ribosomal protein L17 [Bdellovibrionota bacterium]